MDKYIKDNFTGSVDDLLNHCSNLDLDKVQDQVKEEEKELCIDVLMKELDCSEEEAEIIYNDLALKEIQETVDKMVTDGILYISGHNDDGEPLFSLTPLGKQIQKELENGK